MFKILGFLMVFVLMNNLFADDCILTINLHKDIAYFLNDSDPSVLTVRLYTVSFGGTPVASQAFTSGQWNSHLNSKNSLSTETAHFVVDFTNTHALHSNMTLYMEMDIDGSTVGSRELLEPDDLIWNLEVNHITPLGVKCDGIPTASSNTWVKLGNVGTFYKYSTNSYLEFNYTGMALVQSYTGTGVKYELRVDNNPTTSGVIRARVNTANKQQPIAMNGIYPGIGTGYHTVSIWVYSAWGTASGVYIDPGCWQTDQILVKERD